MKTNAIEIIPKDPFKNCKLGRKDYAPILTSIIEAYKEGFVLAVNGKWGTGKTTFMKMWQQSLVDDNYKTIYFNAWENDFTSEPLVSILGEIKGTFVSNLEDGFDKILDKASKFAGKVIPSLAKTALNLAGLGQIADIAESVSNATIEAFNSEIDDYDKKKASLNELRKDLSKFISKQSNGKPLVFIVDELDRCRPDYAVEVLEKIKHFFAVEGIVFVLSIDKEQLCNAIKGYYGSDRIDSPEYLRRFVDLEYTLPEPNYENFAKYLYDYYDFAKFFEQDARHTSGLRFDKDSFFRFIERYSSQKKLSLRQLEKLFAHTRIVSRMFSERNYVHPEVLFFLLTLKEYDNSLYVELPKLQLSLQDVATRLDEIFKDFTTQTDRQSYYYYFEYVFAQLIRFYGVSKHYAGQKEENLCKTDEEGKEVLNFQLRYTDENRILELIKPRGERDYVSLAYYIKKIDLLEPLSS